MKTIEESIEVIKHKIKARMKSAHGALPLKYRQQCFDTATGMQDALDIILEAVNGKQEGQG